MMLGRNAKSSANEQKDPPDIGAILSYPGAREAFDALVENGCDPDIIGRQLQAVALFQRRRQVLEDSAPKGIPLYTIRRLPKRLKDLASQICLINSHEMYEPGKCLAMADRSDLANLPQMLRDLCVQVGRGQPRSDTDAQQN